MEEELLYGTVGLRRFLRHENMSLVTLNDPMILSSTYISCFVGVRALWTSIRGSGCPSVRNVKRSLTPKGLEPGWPEIGPAVWMAVSIDSGG